MTYSSIQSLSQESRIFPPPPTVSSDAWIPNLETYQKMYDQSLKDPERFWGEVAKDFFWFKPWDRVLRYDWGTTDSLYPSPPQADVEGEAPTALPVEGATRAPITTVWFGGGKTNLCVNALDRHLPHHADRLAYLWIGNEPDQEKRITYGELFRDVCRCANVLKKLGVQKGDRVAIYLPMIPELPITMLACARIGAIHSVIFGGFSAEALKDRIVDCRAKLLVTSDGGLRGSKKIPLKETANLALDSAAREGHHVSHCLVVRHTHDPVTMIPERDVEWSDLLTHASDECPAEEVDSEDPLFILYTSGSTGKPKGVLHTTAGYMVHTALSFKYVFDYHPQDLFFCTADIGWVTGHSYLVYGPLCQAASMILFEGIPTHPHPDRLWEIVEKHRVSILYTAPTALRALMREGDEWPKRHDLSSLRILGTVGEPINPEAWIWYHEKIGQRRCPIVDTWWQTETGGILISPLPGATPTKPGSATLPFFGVEPAILRADGSECAVDEGGFLVLKRPWPGMMRTVYGHHERFRETYFSQFPGCYITGDGARKDKDGYYWLLGRIDDVLNVSGHRIGTAEVESALVSHPAVAEAAVVGFPHDIKGQGIYAFVVLKNNVGVDPRVNPRSDKHKDHGEHAGSPLQAILKDHVREEISGIATPDKIQFTNALPKTRSGKIMRRILRKIAEGLPEEIGDTSTLADPQVVQDLLRGR